MAIVCLKCKQGNDGTSPYCGQCNGRLPFLSEARKSFKYFDLISQLDEDSISRSFLARNNVLKKPCIIREYISNNDDVGVELRLDEAAGCFRNATSPYLPDIRVFTEQGHCFVIEYTEGRLLSDSPTYQEGKSVDETRVLLNDLLDAVGELHGLEIYHGNITPQNILRRNVDGRLKLLNFGSLVDATQFVSDGDGKVSASTTHIPRYAPAERLRQSLDATSDIYAVGLTALCYMLGKTPEQSYDQFYKAGSKAWEWGTALKDENLATVLKRMLAPSSTQRFQSVAEVKEALLAASITKETATQGDYQEREGERTAREGETPQVIEETHQEDQRQRRGPVAQPQPATSDTEVTEPVDVAPTVEPKDDAPRIDIPTFLQSIERVIKDGFDRAVSELREVHQNKQHRLTTNLAKIGFLLSVLGLVVTIVAAIFPSSLKSPASLIWKGFLPENPEVWVGRSARLTALAEDPDRHKLNYEWSSSDGDTGKKEEGGKVAYLDTSGGLQPDRRQITVWVTVTGGPGETLSEYTVVTVKRRPSPVIAEVKAEPPEVQPGDEVRLTAIVRNEQDYDQLKYRWRSLKGDPLTETSKALVLRAPLVSSSTKLTYTAVAIDGVNESEPKDTTITVKPPDSIIGAGVPAPAVESSSKSRRRRSQTSSVSFYLREADRLENQRDYPGAIEILNKGRKENPKSKDLEDRLERLKSAKKELDKIIE